MDFLFFEGDMMMPFVRGREGELAMPDSVVRESSGLGNG